MGSLLVELLPSAVVLAAAGASSVPLVDQRTKSAITLAIGLLLLGVALAVLNPNIPILLGGLTAITAAGRGLDQAKDWLAGHERLVDLGVLLVFGVLFALKGLAGL